jgi:hypothetical protein
MNLTPVTATTSVANPPNQLQGTGNGRRYPYRTPPGDLAAKRITMSRAAGVSTWMTMPMSRSAGSMYRGSGERDGTNAHRLQQEGKEQGRAEHQVRHHHRQVSPAQVSEARPGRDGDSGDNKDGRAANVLQQRDGQHTA